MPNKPSPKSSPKPSVKSKPAGSTKPASQLTELLPKSVIHNRQQNLVEMDKAKLEELAVAITNCAKEAHNHAKRALGSAALAIVSAWNCGGLLNLVKENMMHGELQVWFADNIRVPGLSLRTAQRYMKLAKSHPLLEDLIDSNPSIRQAYIACGILAEPPETEKTDEDNDASARISLLKSVASVQTRLRRFSEKKIKIDQKTRKELLATKAEIDQLFKAIVG